MAKSNKLHFYFRDLPTPTISQLKADEEALYSITEYQSANVMSQILSNLPGINSSSIIADLTACVGGNTASFAKHFDNVIAVEIDPEKCDMLKNNMCDIMGFQNITIINGDLLEEMEKRDQDIVFIDPPWGGPEYNNQEYVRLFINEIPLSSVVLRMFGRAKYIAIKLPLNFDCSEFNRAIKPHAKVTYHLKNLRKMKLVIVEPY